MATTDRRPTTAAAAPALLADAVARAELTPLLCAVAHATGDRSLLRSEWRPDQSRLLEPDAGVGPAAQAAARRAVLAALGSVAGPRADEVGGGGDALRASLAFAAGDDAVAPYLPLLRQELGLDESGARADLRAPRWHKDAVAPGRAFRVAVVGAGMSGIAAAHRLTQAGVECVVLEKDADVGGTWFENTYPGCRVDVPNHLYSYSFAPRHDWPHHYSTQPELLAYFRDCAERLGVRSLVRFSTEVVSAEWDDEAAVWRLRVRAVGRAGTGMPAGDAARDAAGDAARTGAGAEETLEAHAVVTAVGQLNRPFVPELPGAASFAGPAFHSARWRHDVLLGGRRVAVVGTGASAAQLVPAVAAQAAHLTVFQRTPNWLVPTPDYRQEVAPSLRWLAGHLDGYAEWHRFWLFWRNAEGILPAVRVEPGWDGGGRSVGSLNEVLRQLLTAYLDEQYAGRPDLLGLAVPGYPPSAKRVVRDDGAWASALRRENVSLTAAPIVRVGPSSVTTADCEEHPADVLVYATGFRASEFLVPMRVTGVGGEELHDAWAGDARAYLGMTVPRYPNLFLLYGPNTNIVVNGSIIYFAECQVGYVLEALRHLLSTGARSLDCRPEVHDAYNAEIDAANARMVWGAPESAGVPSWYRNATGRVSQNWPGTLLEYWQRTAALEPADYVWS